MIQLTKPQGEQFAEDIHGRGPEHAIASLLYESGGSLEIEEIMETLKIVDPNRARMYLGSLRSKGYIREM